MIWDGKLRIDRINGPMAQAHADSPEVIYNALINDNSFMDLVGDWTFEVNNTTLNAISIITPGDKLPELKKVSGLEVMIHDVVNFGRRSYLTGDDDTVMKWKVYLMAWPPANGGTLSAAATRMMEMFSGATTIETAPAPEGIGVIAQVLVMIPSDSIITV
jgi:hypothetical protein